MKCRSGIEIQSKIMIPIQILILNRISIFIETSRSDTKLCGNPNSGHDPDPDPKKKKFWKKFAEQN